MILIEFVHFDITSESTNFMIMQLQLCFCEIDNKVKYPSLNFFTHIFLDHSQFLLPTNCF